MSSKGAQAAVSLIIIISIVVAASITAAFWLLGQTSRLMHELDPEELLLDNTLYYSSSTNTFKISLKNKGSKTSVIEYILLNGKYEATIVSARNGDGESRLTESGDKVYVMAGEEVEIEFKLNLNDEQLKAVLNPSVTNEILIKTARGHEYYKTVKVSIRS